MKRSALLLAAMAMLTGPASTSSAREFVEPDYGFSFTVDDELWKPAPIPVGTLGEPVVVLVDGQPPTMLFDVYVRMGTGPDPISLESILERMERLAAAVSGVKKLANEVVDLAGHKAMSFRMSGPGSGLGITGGGETPTTQHWYGFSRDKDLIVFQVTAASENFDTAFEQFDQIVRTVRIQDKRPAVKPNRVFASQETGLKVSYPAAPWIRGGYELGDFTVPGYLLRLWSAPSESGTTGDAKSNYATRLALFLQFPGKAFTPQELIDLSIPGLTGTIGATVVEQDVREIAGLSAMWLVVEGTSKTGSNLTGTGTVKTRQLWVAIPRVHNSVHSIVVILLNTPAADYDHRLKDVQQLLKTLAVTGNAQ